MNCEIPNYNGILALHEDFMKHRGVFVSDNLKYTNYVAPSSLHSPVSRTAYGTALKKNCVMLSGGGSVKVEIKLDDVISRRFYLKINCMLESWQELNNDMTITINGMKFYSSEHEFVENVCQGWHSLYYEVDAEFLSAGINLVEIATEDSSNAGLLISEVSMVSLPAFKAFSQISCLKTVRVGQTFTVAVYTGIQGCLAENVDAGRNYTFECCIPSPLRPEVSLLKFTALFPGFASARVKFAGSENWLNLAMPQVAEASQDVCLVGTDSDDHRHDMSDEAGRILEIFANTGMGNFVQFRPSRGRTHYEFASKEAWKNRIDFLKEMNVKIAIADTRQHLMGFVPEMAGSSYVGSHIHEPYLFFCLPLENTRHKDVFMLDSKAVLSSSSFGESEELYRSVLRKTYEKNSTRTGLTSVGSPSLLCIYEAAERFDRITIEPVSNLNLLTGAVRGTTGASRMWGAHLPVDWYFGAPNNGCKSRKFRLAMNYLYISGAQYVYTENAVFKTNAFSREDWEDDFTKENRSFLREFYDYTVRNPRKGRLVVKKAVIYGRHEQFYWHHDDRMAELKDMGNWDRKIWGKWEDDSYRKCWRAVDSWLPPSKKQYEFESNVNLKLFSGTPYGNVDVIPWWSDYSRYDTVALLGWNTMNDEMLEKLRQYVYNGGTLFISYCHFNTTDRNDMPQVYLEAEKISEFLGVRLGRKKQTIGNIRFADGFEAKGTDGTLELVECETVNAEVLAQDSEGIGVYFKNLYGKGTVYFGTFAGYFHHDWAVSSAGHVMDIMGKEDGTFCSNPNIAFTERTLDDGSIVIDLVNMNCAVPGGEEGFRLKIGGRLIEGVAKEGVISTFRVE